MTSPYAANKYGSIASIWSSRKKGGICEVTVDVMASDNGNKAPTGLECCRMIGLGGFDEELFWSCTRTVSSADAGHGNVLSFLERIGNVSYTPDHNFPSPNHSELTPVR